MVPLRSSSCLSPDLVLARPFPSALTTVAFDHSRRRWFGTCSCKPIPRGLPSSVEQQSNFELSALHPELLSAPSWRTVIRKTHFLIDQTRRLQQATSSLNEPDEQKDLKTWGAFQPQPNFQTGYDHAMLSRFVDAALEITGAKMANFQLYDPSSGALHLIAHHGFRRDFLDFFSQVHEGETACGAALKNRERGTVEDVTESPIFFGKAALEALLDAGV